MASGYAFDLLLRVWPGEVETGHCSLPAPLTQRVHVAVADGDLLGVEVLEERA
jgi:hypothetical protein